jgi:hypothetical protein
MSAPPPPAAPTELAPAPAAAQPVSRPDDLASLSRAVMVLLTWGFRVGAALLALGIVLSLITRDPLNPVATPFADILPTIRAGRAAGVVDLAILWLMTVPVGAVVLLVVGFSRLGDRRYALISLFVLAVLGVSIALALAR